MDAIIIYEYQVVDGAGNPVADPSAGVGVDVTLTAEYASGCLIQHAGYIVSGSTADGTYLEVRDSDTGAGTDVDFFLIHRRVLDQIPVSEIPPGMITSIYL